MTHDDVRAALVSDDPVPAAAHDHLARCDACLAFAQGLDRVRRAAPLLVPAGAPAGLADRVVTALAEAPAPAVAPVVPLARRSFARRALVRTAVAAAATLVIGAVGVAVRDDREAAPRTVLAAAAERTAEAGTAKVRVEGTTTFVVPVPRDPQTPPDYASVPEALRDHVDQQWRAVLEMFQEALDRAQQQIDDALEQIDDALDGFLGTSGPSGPRPPRPPRGPRQPPAPPSPPALPPSITTTVTVRASGDVSFTDRLRLNGVVGVDGRADLDLVAGRDAVAVRADGSAWAVADGRVGPWSAVIGGPDELLRAVSAATDVQPLVEGRRYRFRIRTPDGTTLGGEADLDDRGLLSAVRLTGSGGTGGLAGTSWTTDVRVALTDPGSPVAPEPVDVSDVQDRLGAPDVASRVLYPFGAGVRAAVTR